MEETFESETTEKSVAVGSGRLYYEAPFDFEEIVSVTVIEGEIGYCDCCDEKAILRQRITTFAEKKYVACGNCGQKVQRVLVEMNSFK